MVRSLAKDYFELLELLKVILHRDYKIHVAFGLMLWIP